MACAVAHEISLPTVAFPAVISACVIVDVPPCFAFQLSFSACDTYRLVLHSVTSSEVRLTAPVLLFTELTPVTKLLTVVDLSLIHI